MRLARKVPVIHDISTDTEDPPRFEAILALRKNALNPPDYGGPEIAAQQKAAFPEIQTLRSDLAPRDAFDQALSASRRLGWALISQDPAAGRIEAVDTTFWFGFKDDVVIRVRPAAKGSLIDLRSVSRVGKGDAGTNARRIRRFLDLLKA